MRARDLRVGLATAALCALAACGKPAGPRAAPAAVGLTANRLPVGALAGDVQSPALLSVQNPFAGQPDAIAQGKVLFVKMNCAGCHAYDLAGNMGPNLADRYWRYGGTPGAVYQSIARGRPQGMPSWGRALPPADIWRLVAYIQSYGGMTPAAQYQAGEQGDLAGAPPSAPGEAKGGGTGQAAGKSRMQSNAAQSAAP